MLVPCFSFPDLSCFRREKVIQITSNTRNRKKINTTVVMARAIMAVLVAKHLKNKNIKGQIPS
jgi:hypothetical protein